MEKDLLTLGIEQEVEWLSLRQANKIGIIVASLLILSGIGIIFEEPTPQTFEMMLPKTSPRPDSLGKVEFEKVKIPVEPDDPKYDRFAQSSEVGFPLGVGICLLLRSFLSGFTFFRVVLIVLGGMLVGFPVVIVVYGIVCYGFPNIGVLLGNLLIMGIGLLFLKYGFRPKVFKWLG